MVETQGPSEKEGMEEEWIYIMVKDVTERVPVRWYEITTRTWNVCLNIY